MKRDYKIAEPLLKSEGAKLWAFIHCMGENIAIAISTVPIEIGNVPPITCTQWGIGCAEFRFGYFIDFSKILPGQKVTCPKCGSAVDFRLIPSTDKPKFK